MKTLGLVNRFASKDQKIIDLGPPNPMAELLIKDGYRVQNTPEGLDLDFSSNHELLLNDEYEVLTSFEVFEHLVNPFGVLYHSKAKMLITTVPLKLWFKDAYWNESDPFDRHYHEFESRQFDMLLEKAGWSIVHREKWKSISFKLGIRPVLRNIYPRYYAVVAIRNEG